MELDFALEGIAVEEDPELLACPVVPDPHAPTGFGTRERIRSRDRAEETEGAVPATGTDSSVDHANHDSLFDCGEAEGIIPPIECPPSLGREPSPSPPLPYVYPKCWFETIELNGFEKTSEERKTMIRST